MGENSSESGPHGSTEEVAHIGPRLPARSMSRAMPWSAGGRSRLATNIGDVLQVCAPHKTDQSRPVLAWFTVPSTRQ